MARSADNTKTVAVLLSTSPEGQSVVKGLLKSKSRTNPTLKLHIIALTRQTRATPSTDWFDPFPHSFEFVQCNLSNQNELVQIFRKYKVWGVYCLYYNSIFTGTDQETADGKTCIDAAIQSNVSFFILSSVVGAYTAPQEITHIHAKYEIDQYLINQTTFHEIFTDGWLILRTTWHMDNLLTKFVPKNGYLTIPIVEGDVKYAVVAVDNIGHIAAEYFIGNKKIPTQSCFYDCIGDEVSGNEICAVLSKASGHNVLYSNSDIMFGIYNALRDPIAMASSQVLEWYNSGVVHGNMQQCYQDFGNRMIDFKEFSETHFKNKPLGESITRKVVKYSTLITIIGGVAMVGRWLYGRDKSKQST
eukprot:186544_1